MDIKINGYVSLKKGCDNQQSQKFVSRSFEGNVIWNLFGEVNEEAFSLWGRWVATVMSEVHWEAESFGGCFSTDFPKN
jgi:hypothetical protein